MEDVSSVASVADASSLAAQLEASPLAAVARFTALGNRNEAARVWRRRADSAAGRGRRRQVARAKQMISLGFMVTSHRLLNGLTALHAAVACGPPGAVALDTMLAALATLPKAKRPLGIRDWHGLTPLAHAVQANWGDGVRKLVAAGAQVSEPYSFKSISEFERVPGIGASLLSFAVALNHMEAFQALIECGADAKLWDRNGMRAVHIAVICGNMTAVHDLMALDGGLGVLSKEEAVELYTVREKFEKRNPFSTAGGRNANGDEFRPDDLGSPDDAMHIEMVEDDDNEDESPDSNNAWGRAGENNPNHSRDFYRTMTSELDDFDLEQVDNSDNEDNSDAAQMDSDYSDDEGEDGGSENERFGGSTDSDSDMEGMEEDQSDSENDNSDDDNIPTKKLNEKDAAFVTALMLALNGALEPAVEKFAAVQKGFKATALESKPQLSTHSMVPPPPSMQRQSENGGPPEPHVVRVGDMMHIHMSSNDDDEPPHELGMFVLNAVLRALSISRESLYGATLLHLAVKRRHHDVIRFLLEQAPCAQPVDMQMNNGMTALHIAAEDGDPVAIELLVGAQASVHCRADADNSTPLMRAAKKGRTGAVKILLEKGARVADEDDEGLTSLHFATEHKKGVEVVEMLVAAGADVNAETADGCTPAYTAVSFGNMEVFRKVLELGGDPSIPNVDGSVPLGFIATKSMKELALFAQFVAANPLVKEKVDMDVVIGDQGTTALHLAASEGSPAAVEGLLKAGCDVNKLNEYGMSALVLAARSEEVTPEDRLAIMAHLLEGGADVKIAGEEGKQALHFVTFLGEYDAVELLLRFGADPMVMTKNKTPLHLVSLENFPSIAELLIQKGSDINPKDDIGMTPLMYAALRHSTDVLKVLIDHGADMSHRAEAGMTALHIAGVTNHPEAEETVRLLCKAGAPMDIKDDQGMYPIHLHGDFGRTRCVRRMLMAGCNPDMRCGAGFTPLIRACNARNLISDNLTLIRVLLRGGADVNAKNDNNNTVMSYLGDTDEHALIRIMLAAGADINIADLQGDTPLHEAAMGNHARTVTLLARRGANVNARNKKMETALFIASTNGFVDVVKSLVHKRLKTDMSLPNIDGVSPYEVARQKGHDRVTAILLDATGLRLSQFAPLITYSIPSPRKQAAVDGLRRHDSGRVICPICQEPLQFGEKVRRLPCGHAFHDPCILPWLGGERMTNNRTCPVCKQMVAPAELFPTMPQ